MNNDAVSSLVYSLRDSKKEIYRRISIIENKKKQTLADSELLEELNDKLEDIDQRLRRFEDAIINRLES